MLCTKGFTLRCRVLYILKNFRRSLADQLYLNYKYGSPEQIKLREAIEALEHADISVPSLVKKKKIFSGDEQYLKCPHNHKKLLARFYYCNRTHLALAMEAALKRKESWRNMVAADRANIWRKCADIIAGEQRFHLNAAIMLGQGKTCRQAEEDTCQLLKSLRAQADSLEELDRLKIQTRPECNIHASVQLRPLDGFVAAITPFNLASMSANMALRPALMGNCVLWKPSNNCVLSSYIVYNALMEAGLPSGVLSFVPTNPKLFTDCITNSPHLVGVNFMGQLVNCHDIWQDVAFRLKNYRSIPRLVGECGGKNYHLVHETAKVDLVVEATVQAAFDYSGQYCNACSRLYVPESLWPAIKCGLQHESDALKVGDPNDFSTYCSAVITEPAFDRIVSYLLYAQKSADVDVVSGGDFCKTVGYFVEPTVLLCRNPMDRLMTEEILGPVLSVYVYPNNDFEKILKVVDDASSFAYTGSIFSADDKVICHVLKKLRMTAGNLYVNCKCTGSIDGNQPFSGGRLSSTKDYHGTAHNLLRWTTPQLIEESFPCNG